MLFFRSKPSLRIICLPQEHARSCVAQRMDGILHMWASHYHIEWIETKTYNDIKFDQCYVVEHEDGKFKVIDWSDRDNPTKMESGDIIHHHLCQYVLKCQYNPTYRVPKLRPFFYFEKTDPKGFSNICENLRDLPKTHESTISWFGNFRLGRNEILHSLKDLLNYDYQETYPLTEYYQKTAQATLVLSLPGQGKTCHREFECFGLGTPVIAPKFKNIHHVPLIENVHYICVDCRKGQHMSDAIRDRINRVTDDELEFIRYNAMLYYDTYIRYENSLYWWSHLLEL